MSAAVASRRSCCRVRLATGRPIRSRSPSALFASSQFLASALVPPGRPFFVGRRGRRDIESARGGSWRRDAGRERRSANANRFAVEVAAKKSAHGAATATPTPTPQRSTGQRRPAGTENRAESRVTATEAAVVRRPAGERDRTRSN